MHACYDEVGYLKENKERSRSRWVFSFPRPALFRLVLWLLLAGASRGGCVPSCCLSPPLPLLVVLLCGRCPACPCELFNVMDRVSAEFTSYLLDFCSAELSNCFP
jgi:hypothetical protein